MAKSRQQTEFGDFQTPPGLAREVCRLLQAGGLSPRSVVEPTCGLGSLLLAAMENFPCIECAHGLDINGNYLGELEARLPARGAYPKVTLHHADFFATDWSLLLDSLPQPILIIGNPPWVTNAELGRLGSENLPRKTNFQNYSGLDAITGKSNFDVSEWMLVRLMNLLEGRSGTVAVLCKTAVARKVLAHAWSLRLHIKKAAVYEIESLKHFGAAVHACLLVCDFDPKACVQIAALRGSLNTHSDIGAWGWRGGQLVANVNAYDEHEHLQSDTGNGAYIWRSGVKHDCSQVMELREDGGRWVNKLGQKIDLEPEFLFPMLKSSEVANGRISQPVNWMLVTQRSVGADTTSLQQRAPKTWHYLTSHSERLDNRRSSIYRNRPRFSVFGVGSYSFAPYKVAISGFYKRLSFQIVGSYCDKPIVLDDTVYFLPCQTEDEATLIASLLNSREAAKFFSAYIFWDAKRPITVELLRKLDLRRLAAQLDCVEEYDEHAMRRSQSRKQPTLF